MKKNFIQILLLIVVSTRSFAQPPTEAERYEYAKSVLREGLRSRDSVKIAEGYYLLAKREVRMLRYSHAYYLFYTSLRINQKINDHSNVGRVYLRLSELELDQHNFEKSKDFLKKAFAVYQKYNLTEGLKSAKIASEQINVVYALHFKKNIFVNNLKPDSVSIAFRYQEIANIRVAEFDYAEAYHLYYLALKIFTNLQDYPNAAHINLHLAQLESLQSHFKESTSYLNTAISTYKRYNLQNELLYAYRSAGEIYTRNALSDTVKNKLDFKRGLYYFKLLEKQAISKKNEYDIASARMMIGHIYNYLKDERAIQNLEYAVKIKRQQKPDFSLINYQTNLASAYLIFNKLDKANSVLEDSQRLIDSKLYNIDFASISNHNSIYSLYYQAIGDWENTFKKYVSSKEFYIKHAEIDKQGNLSKWRVKMEAEKKDLEIKLQKQQNESSQKLIKLQQLFIGLAILFFLILAILTYFLYNNLKKQKILAQRNAILVQEQNHRVKNNFQVISSMLNLQVDYLNDKNSKSIFSESQTRIDSMVLLHRQLYENDELEFIDIQGLIHEIANSVALTFGTPDMTIESDMEIKELKIDLATSIGLIFNELIINSFKYAFKNKKPCVEINSYKKGNLIEFTYKDFGEKDLSDIFEQPSNNKSYGLNLIDMILFQINGTLKYSYRQGSIFTISFINS